MKRSNLKAPDRHTITSFICPTYVERNPRSVTCRNILLKKEVRGSNGQEYGVGHWSCPIDICQCFGEFSFFQTEGRKD